jgi:hypothetical protein
MIKFRGSRPQLIKFANLQIFKLLLKHIFIFFLD